ncbi:unnamed protein product [Durusdinium trenchii]|uniref:Uncharacterized protein n=2 Tax=Durusdinium trenchii TaxID=1381693 RepID=A0ABP0IA07_9DINO
MARVLCLLFSVFSVFAEETPSLRGAGDKGDNLHSTDVACTGTGSLSSEGPSCYGGNILGQSYALEVTNFDGSSGVVNMHADGAAITGECHGAEFHSNENIITVENYNGCLLGALKAEYKVHYCPDQDYVIVNVLKPFDVRVVLPSQSCAGEV